MVGISVGSPLLITDMMSGHRSPKVDWDTDMRVLMERGETLCSLTK
uniref:Phosphopantothenoylcysteine decarboxylase n=1 Tax=Echinococcus granulosus TaxID=6210 RepID=A0A068WPY4_ECHGR|nr:hypothetical protein EgrG_000503100 [Echinococcus granulosus]